MSIEMIIHSKKQLLSMSRMSREEKETTNRNIMDRNR